MSSNLSKFWIAGKSGAYHDDVESEDLLQGNFFLHVIISHL